MQQELSFVVAFLAVACALLLGVGLVLLAARVSAGPGPDTRLAGMRLVGQWGRVVMAIPHAGVGLVRVAGVRVVTGVPARSLERDAIALGQKVVVVDVRDGVLEVTPSGDELIHSIAA